MTKHKHENELMEAIRFAMNDDWDDAHKIVQKYEDDNVACWIHAILHKIEGDTDNAKYWHRRSGRPWTAEDPKVELKRIFG
jgi:hypothetical protein